MIRLGFKPSPSRALTRFGIRQSIKGAAIVALVSGGQLALQGVAYQKAFSTIHQQEKLAASLANAPGLGFIYGDPLNLRNGTAGYMVYRVLGFMGVVVAIWSLMTVTKMLRGAEEDGRWEVVRACATTSLRATWDVSRGFVFSWLIALGLSFIITMFAVSSGHIHTSVEAMWLLNVAIFLPGFVFAGVGILTSQLAQSRFRALMYGVVPIVALFLMRGAANTSASLHWLLYATPFGWSQLVNPVRSPDKVWILPLFGLGLLVAGIGFLLTRRDYGESFITEKTEVRSHFALLRTPWQLSLRQNSPMLVGWAIGAMTVVGLISALANTAVNALQSSGGLAQKLDKLAGNTNSLKVAFLGAGILFMIMLLLVMSIHVVGAIRRDEAKQYLDNILVGPQRRTNWLVSRLLLTFSVVLGVSLLGGLALYLIAGAENIPLDFWKVITTCVCAVGSAAFLIGLGALLYGFVPRAVFFAMYAVIGWSFLITLLESAAKLNTVLVHSSLFLYTNFNLAQWPDWETFGWMIAIGLVLAYLGVVAFNRRDIVSE